MARRPLPIGTRGDIRTEVGELTGMHKINHLIESVGR
jgi:hypothetical protein